MTTQLVIDICATIKSIDPAMNAYPDGGQIRGYYRGKSSEGYAYQIGKGFLFNNKGYKVAETIKTALQQHGLEFQG